MLFLFAVNTKKDSESAPVKGGTMTDLGKPGSPKQAVPEAWGSSAHLPVALCSCRGSACLLSLADEQDDESMETTGKVQPV
jgi:hypothetical protein